MLACVGMKAFDLWDRLRTSFWFVPSLMAGAAVALSFVMLEIDARLGPAFVGEVAWLYRFGPEGARTLLSSIASSMITVAGLTFSITMVTLQLASSQFGPRLLRNIIRDRGNQVVLGSFVATFLYCLLVLRTVRGTDGSSVVPHLSAAVGVLLAVVSIAVLIYFIHHVASTIRIESLLAALASEARTSIERLYPEPIGRNPHDEAQPAPVRVAVPDFEADARRVFKGDSGYVQAIDADELVRVAVEFGIVVRIDAPPGRFVDARSPLLTASPAAKVSDRCASRLGSAVVVGLDRTPVQDLEYAVRRLVEVAQRAMSPGMNDPTTALYCVDRLVEAFELLASREPPSPFRLDENGRLRVVAEPIDAGELACCSFAAIARYALGDADVSACLVRAVSRLALSAGDAERDRLVALGDEIGARAAAASKLSFDRETIDDARRALLRVKRSLS